MQRPQSNKKRAVIRLSGSLEKKLIGYAAAASAAGVGILACSLPAEGRVVTTLSWTQISPNGNVILDLNNDGIPDFQFSNRNYATSNIEYGTLKVFPQNGSNAIWGSGKFASALGSGVRIGSNSPLQPEHQLLVDATYYCVSYACHYYSQGPWKQITRKYLGLKFTIRGEIHYGWARLNVTATDRGVYAAVTEYAYETEPNKPIVTGDERGSEKNTHPRRLRMGDSL